MRDTYYLGDITMDRLEAIAYLMPAVNYADGQEDGSTYWLNRIELVRRTPKRQGKGTELLTKICEEADRENVTLLLGVQPDNYADFQWLAKWYTKHGFVAEREPLSEIENVMVRKPQNKESK